jgi:hypothetical protein
MTFGEIASLSPKSRGSDDPLTSRMNLSPCYMFSIHQSMMSFSLHTVLAFGLRVRMLGWMMSVGVSTLSAQPSAGDLLKIFSASDEKAMESLYELSGGKTHARWLAINGYARATMADFAFNPYKKFSRFDEGKAQLEKAVAAAPDDAAIRLMRLMIQLECPGFLGYRDAIDEDFERVLAHLRKRPEGAEAGFWQKAREYLNQTRALDKEKQEKLKQLPS